jgi:kinesin family protein 18/19
MNEDGNYLSHSDAEPLLIKNKKQKFGNPSGKSPLKKQGGQSDTNTNNHLTQEYIEEMKQGVSKIMVAVRLRPMWKKETEKGEISIVKIMDRNVVILRDPADVLAEEKVLGKNRTKEKQYAFDFAFDEDTNQLEVFKNTTKFLCEGVLNGYNSTVFAYGQTGAGKTYTMLGNEQNPGIMFNTMKQVFKAMKKLSNDREYTIRVSFLEIYNENIKDLIMVS